MANNERPLTDAELHEAEVDALSRLISYASDPSSKHYPWAVQFLRERGLNLKEPNA